MSARIFKLEIDGAERYGLLFDSEVEMQTFLGTRGVVLVNAEPPAQPPERRGRGRPSFDDVIEPAAEAVADQIGDASIDDAAGLVQAEIARTNPEATPSTKTIANWLRSQKCSQKSRRAKIAAGGE